MGVKAYNLYNRKVYPIQSVDKQKEERQVGKQKAGRVVMVAAGDGLSSTMCAMVIVECASLKKSVRGYWMVE